MQRVPQRRFHVISLTFALLATAVTAAPAADISCLTCHEKERALYTPSAHAQAGLTCVDCHGGDPKATDVTAHATDNFKRPDNKKAIAELCASCHGDVRRMNPYGLPTDQLDRYKTSKHGEQLFEHNDQKVAVCIDCHGVHDILKVKSPQAHVYPTNIPQTCGRCHGDAKLMQEYKLPTDIVTQYKSSYHAYMVFEKGDLSAPTCVTCHGSHGATPPGTKEVGEVCGKCHGRQRELFLKSPHAEAAAAGLFNECVSCHGNHGIQKTSVKLFAKTCVQCHAKDPKQLQLRDDIAGLIHRTQNDYTNAVTVVHDATVRGLATDDEQLLLQEAKTQVTQLEALQHTLAVDQLQPVAARADEAVHQTLANVGQLEQFERWKRHALTPIWVFLTLMAIMFWAKRRQLEQGRKS
ncbi:MAG: cytochrome c3 family protein [Verrucomicrobiia bacterium]|jgi:cytochrome c553